MNEELEMKKSALVESLVEEGKALGLEFALDYAKDMQAGNDFSCDDLTNGHYFPSHVMESLNGYDDAYYLHKEVWCKIFAYHLSKIVK